MDLIVGTNILYIVWPTGVTFIFTLSAISHYGWAWGGVYMHISPSKLLIFKAYLLDGGSTGLRAKMRKQSSGYFIKSSGIHCRHEQGWNFDAICNANVFQISMSILTYENFQYQWH